MQDPNVSPEQCEQRMTRIHERLDDIGSDLGQCKVTMARIEERLTSNSGFIGHAASVLVAIIGSWFAVHFGPGGK